MKNIEMIVLHISLKWLFNTYFNTLIRLRYLTIIYFLIYFIYQNLKPKGSNF